MKYTFIKVSHINVNPLSQLQLRSLLFHLPETSGRGNSNIPKVHGTWAFYCEQGSEYYLGSKR